MGGTKEIAGDIRENTNGTKEAVLYGIFLKFTEEQKLQKLWQDGRNLPLTGTEWDFDAMDMFYLFMEIEQAFNITIPGKKLENYAFNTVTGILKILTSGGF